MKNVQNQIISANTHISEKKLYKSAILIPALNLINWKNYFAQLILTFYIP